MSELENEVTYPEADRGEAAMSILGMTYQILDNRHVVMSPKITREPQETPIDYVAKLVAPMIDGRRNKIGEVRVFVYVPKEWDDATVLIEWTRDAMGFWFQKEVVLKDGASDVEGISLTPLKNAVHHVNSTARGSVPLESMLRTMKTRKKDRTRDFISAVGIG